MIMDFEDFEVEARKIKAMMNSFAAMFVDNRPEINVSAVSVDHATYSYLFCAITDKVCALCDNLAEAAGNGVS